MKHVLHLICFLLLGVLLNAQSTTPAPVTLEQVVQEALDKNLGLLAEKYNLSIAEARLVTARLRPNPVFSFGADYQDWLGAGFSPTRGVGPAEVNFRTDFLLERGGKRKSRIEVAENARGVAQLELLNSTRTLLLDVQNAFIEVILAKESLALARENLKAFQEIVSINSARVNAGDLAQVELVRSRVAALQFRNAVLQAEARLRTARTRLQTLMGRTIPSPGFDVSGEFKRSEVQVALPELRQQALERRPDLQALDRDQARSLANIRQQEALGKVDLTIGAQIHRQYGDGVQASGNALGLFFSAPLPLFNRNQGEIQRARQEQRQIEARIQALRSEILNEVENAYQQWQTSKDLLASIETGMLEQARQVRETTEYSYRRGEASFVELLDAQRAFNDTVQSYNEARADFAKSLYLIDSITGKGVNP